MGMEEALDDSVEGVRAVVLNGLEVFLPLAGLADPEKEVRLDAQSTASFSSPDAVPASSRASVRRSSPPRDEAAAYIHPYARACVISIDRCWIASVCGAVRCRRVCGDEPHP